MHTYAMRREVRNCWHLMEGKRVCGRFTCLIEDISPESESEKISVPKDSKGNKGLFRSLGNFRSSLERFHNYKPDTFFEYCKGHKPFLQTGAPTPTSAQTQLAGGKGAAPAPPPAALEPQGAATRKAPQNLMFQHHQTYSVTAAT